MMKYEVNRKTYEMESEKVFTIKEASKVVGIDFTLFTRTQSADENMMLRVIGFSKELGVFLIEPKFMLPLLHLRIKDKKFVSLTINQTRKEQLQAFTPDELATFISSDGSRLNLKEKKIIFEFPLSGWFYIIGRADLMCTIDHHDADIIYILLKANEPLQIEEISEKMECDTDVALKLIKMLQRVEHVESQNLQGKTFYALAQHIYEEMTEITEIRDKEMLGECDDPSYISGRIFAVLDRVVIEHNNKGLTKQEFERACCCPFDTFCVLIFPTLDYIDDYLQLSYFMAKLQLKLGTTEDGCSNMPKLLNKESRKMFIQGFEDMYNSMTHEALEFDQKWFEATER